MVHYILYFTNLQCLFCFFWFRVWSLPRWPFQYMISIYLSTLSGVQNSLQVSIIFCDVICTVSDTLILLYGLNTKCCMIKHNFLNFVPVCKDSTEHPPISNSNILLWNSRWGAGWYCSCRLLLGMVGEGGWRGEIDEMHKMPDIRWCG